MTHLHLCLSASRRGSAFLLLAALVVALSGAAAMAEPSAAEQALWQRIRKVQEAHLRAIRSFEASYEAGLLHGMPGDPQWASSANVVAAEFDMMKPQELVWYDRIRSASRFLDDDQVVEGSFTGRSRGLGSARTRCSKRRIQVVSGR